MKVIGVLLSLLTILFAGLAAANTIEIDEQFTSEKINSVYYSFAPTSIATAQQSDLKQWQTLTNKPLNLGPLTGTGMPAEYILTQEEIALQLYNNFK